MKTTLFYVEEFFLYIKQAYTYVKNLCKDKWSLVSEIKLGTVKINNSKTVPVGTDVVSVLRLVGGTEDDVTYQG